LGSYLNLVRKLLYFDGKQVSIINHSETQMSQLDEATQSDYPLSEVPLDQRKGLWPMSVILLGFTFFTATMFAGGKIGTAFSFGELLFIIVVGNLILGVYASALTTISTIPIILLFIRTPCFI
jgi:hypothetical protein